MLAERGWSQGELARSTKLTIQCINAIANGRRQPSYPTLLKIATSLGLNISDLAGAATESATGNGRRAS
jgi:DNA-binding XRE family transcriptional regulator